MAVTAAQWEGLATTTPDAAASGVTAVIVCADKAVEREERA